MSKVFFDPAAGHKNGADIFFCTELIMVGGHIFGIMPSTRREAKLTLDLEP